MLFSLVSDAMLHDYFPTVQREDKAGTSMSMLWHVTGLDSDATKIDKQPFHLAGTHKNKNKKHT